MNHCESFIPPDADDVSDGDYVAVGESSESAVDEQEQFSSFWKSKKTVNIIGSIFGMIYLVYFIVAFSKEEFNFWSLVFLIPIYWCGTYKDPPDRFRDTPYYGP